ncbi:EAL domain-containing protein [Bradyrhizobium sediminis]|uniref:EAL domain-containing protein n=1 Tax=Bradyrhizobium sediminis TaxID=2840469 RepID=A0A975NH69_9BRAD|nr:EAL domain-containing protein [Bradyrhizobium sediminis]QWG14486.1 EAL domain-containing protein [Bradyrhizobium sediminis]
MVDKLKTQNQSEASDRERQANSLAMLETHRRDLLLEAIARSAKELLRASDLTRSIPKVLEHIGLATSVGRMHMLEVDPTGPIDEGRIISHNLWSAAGISTPAGFNDARGRTMVEVGLQSWIPKLMRGESVAGLARDFEDPVRRFFELGGVKSAVAVPVFAEDQWWGLIGFDDCRSERKWSPREIDALRTLAELVGAAITQTRRLQKFSDANRIVENSPTMLYRLSAQPPFGLIYLSQNVRRYGYDAEELLASPSRWMQLIESEYHPAIAADIKSIIEGRVDSTLLEFRLKKSDGSLVWLEGRGYAVRDEKHRLVAIEGVLNDITERKSADEKIAAMVRTDLLTGLANRAAFIERLQLAFARSQRGANPFAVHYLDLDHFKDINDTLGHPAGDALLRAVADRLRGCVRETDLVARFGGDEFAVLQDDISDLVGVEAMATKIGASLAAPFSIDGNQVHTTASIGIVPYDSDADGPEAMMRKADLALYRAKDEGRNQFRFHMAELDRQLRERMMLAADLHLAIERQEFELYYQPQVELESGRIVGLEALIRWNHPTRGLLLPTVFIPIAETTGSILPIGKWAIEQACRQIRLWRDQGVVPPLVAVNISAAQFKGESDLDRIVANSLARFGVAPSALELELTESVLMETTQKHKGSLERLRQLGVRLAIDDFGTGYSSMSYLRRFPFDRIKIDKSFIDDVATQNESIKIVRAIVTLAEGLGMSTIAEGVESADQVDKLRELGCDQIQGFFFSNPRPAGEIAGLLAQKLEGGHSAAGYPPPNDDAASG